MNLQPEEKDGRSQRRKSRTSDAQPNSDQNELTLSMSIAATCILIENNQIKRHYNLTF